MTDKEILNFIKDRTMLSECIEQTFTTYQLKELIREALNIDDVSQPFYCETKRGCLEQCNDCALTEISNI